MSKPKVAAADVKAWLPKSKSGNLFALSFVVRKWDIGELKDARIYNAAYGIGWAIETCRVSGAIALALKSMSYARFATLMATVANECSTIGGVPRWLIQNVKTEEQG